MHLFLYKAARHAPNIYNRRRYVQGTIRGDFDLELLRRCIKGKFKIMPHGEHDIQSALGELDLGEEFYGHIVAIEEARNAVWFKLNYDQVGKNVTEYVGGWRDLARQDIEQYITEFKELKARRGLINQQISNVRYQASTVFGFLNPRTEHVGDIRDVLTEGHGYHLKLIEVGERLKGKSGELEVEMTAIQDKVRAYLKERRL